MPRTVLIACLSLELVRVYWLDRPATQNSSGLAKFLRVAIGTHLVAARWELTLESKRKSEERKQVRGVEKGVDPRDPTG